MKAHDRYLTNEPEREAAKKFMFLVGRPLRGGGVRATKKNWFFWSSKKIPPNMWPLSSGGVRPLKRTFFAASLTDAVILLSGIRIRCRFIELKSNLPCNIYWWIFVDFDINILLRKKIKSLHSLVSSGSLLLFKSRSRFFISRVGSGSATLPSIYAVQIIYCQCFSYPYAEY